MQCYLAAPTRVHTHAQAQAVAKWATMMTMVTTTWTATLRPYQRLYRRLLFRARSSRLRTPSPTLTMRHMEVVFAALSLESALTLMPWLLLKCQQQRTQLARPINYHIMVLTLLANPTMVRYCCAHARFAKCVCLRSEQ